MIALLLYLLAPLGGEASFNTRIARQETLNACWPLSAPLVMLGCSNEDAEIKFRCDEILTNKPAVWRSIQLLAKYPGAVLELTAPKPPVLFGEEIFGFPSYPIWWSGEPDMIHSVLTVATNYGAFDPVKETMETGYDEGLRYVLWLRIRAIQAGVTPVKARSMTVIDLKTIVPKQMPSK